MTHFSWKKKLRKFDEIYEFNIYIYNHVKEKKKLKYIICNLFFVNNLNFSFDQKKMKKLAFQYLNCFQMGRKKTS